MANTPVSCLFGSQYLFFLSFLGRFSLLQLFTIKPGFYPYVLSVDSSLLDFFRSPLRCQLGRKPFHIIQHIIKHIFRLISQIEYSFACNLSISESTLIFFINFTVNCGDVTVQYDFCIIFYGVNHQANCSKLIKFTTFDFLGRVIDVNFHVIGNISRVVDLVT